MKKIKIITITEEMGFIEGRKYFVDELNKMITDDVVEIITNGNLATTMLDFMGYDLSNIEINKLEKDENGKAKKYPMGTLSEKQLLVDPYMRWDDNRIIFSNGNVLEVIDESMMLI